MSTQIVWRNPFTQMDQIQNRLATLWERSPFRFTGSEGNLTISAWSPQMEAIADNQDYGVKAGVRGMRREDIKTFRR